MEGYWNWSGKYIGTRQHEYLVSYDGTVIGKFWGSDIYNADGEYLGEVGRNKRLVRNLVKAGQRRTLFSHYVRGTITQRFSDIAAYPLSYGWENFEM